MLCMDERDVHDKTAAREPPSGSESNESGSRLLIGIRVIDQHTPAAVQRPLNGGCTLLPRAQRVAIDHLVI